MYSERRKLEIPALYLLWLLNMATRGYVLSFEITLTERSINFPCMDYISDFTSFSNV